MMRRALMTPDEMGEADRIAGNQLADGTWTLMENAGAAIVETILGRFGEASRYAVLCGPGNNGGDGYVAASALARLGLPVSLYALGEPAPGTDAARAAVLWTDAVEPLSAFAPSSDTVVIDALFGAGLCRPLDDAAASAAERVRISGARVVSVDLPSGLSGLTGQPLGVCFRADCTISFFRAKPGHLLEPGRSLCGLLVIADIGISESVLAQIAPQTFENAPDIWQSLMPVPKRDAHKYRRGHVGVVSGGVTSTGAARLSAMAAARSGAGAVTVLSPSSAVLVNAANLTATMLRRVDRADDLDAFIRERGPRAFVIGPGAGVGETTRALALAALRSDAGTVLDADAITSFAEDPQALFQTAGGTIAVLTPHDGEFARLFPDLTVEAVPSKLDRARHAAARSGCVLVLKGPDTVIAAPDGRAAINTNGSPWLATAGSGDILAGIVAGLLAQGMPGFEAACAAVWMHAEAGTRFGPGLIAEDMPGLLPAILREVLPLPT